MSSVSVREFSHNPSAIFARVQRGETVEVTKYGQVVAVMIPPPRNQSRYRELVASGAIRPADRDLTTRDLDEFTRIDVPDEADPLSLLLQPREGER